MIDGNPAIAYCGWTGPDTYALKYIRSITNTGENETDWTQRVTIDESSELTGLDASLAVIYGSPAIAYRDNTNDVLRFAKANTSTGAGLGDWDHVETVHDDPVTGSGSSLELVSGNPAICYRSFRKLMYAYYQD